MFFHGFTGRVLGLVTCCVVLSLHCDRLLAADVSASPESAEVATKYKAERLAEFHLADYEFELLECSALAAVHSLIDDNLGEDEGREVRNALAKKYWIDVSHDYLSLAREASGEADLYQEVGIQMRGLVAKCTAWRRPKSAPTTGPAGTNSPTDVTPGARRNLRTRITAMEGAHRRSGSTNRGGNGVGVNDPALLGLHRPASNHDGPHRATRRQPQLEEGLGCHAMRMDKRYKTGTAEASQNGPVHLVKTA